MFPNYEFRFRSVSVLSIDPFLEYPARFHKQVEIGFVTRGEVSISIEGKRYQLKEGDLYIVFPNIVHFTSPSDGAGVVVIANSEMFPSFFRQLTHFSPQDPILRAKEVPEVLEKMFLRTKSLAEDENPLNQGIYAGYISAILGETLLRLDLRERSGDSDLLQQLMMYLLNHYTRDISLEELAKAVGYSKWYISKVIASTFRCNFRTLVNSYRVSMAQSLLLSTENTVSSIAYECGFKNQSSFNRVFLEISGVTPSEFRQQNGPVIQKPEIFYR